MYGFVCGGAAGASGMSRQCVWGVVWVYHECGVPSVSGVPNAKPSALHDMRERAHAPLFFSLFIFNHRDERI